MAVLILSASTLVAFAAAALLAAGIYTEAHRAPDQS